MAESAVTFLLTQLSTWLGEEQKLLGRLRSEAQIIHDDLLQVRALLRDADAIEVVDPKLEAFMKRVREITYDMEDVLESYMLISSSGTLVDCGPVKRFYASIKNLKAKHKLASEIKVLRSRLEHAFKTFKETATVLPGSSSSVAANDTYYDGRGDALLLAEADVVGIERPKKQLLQWIGTADYTLKVISVVGMAGLGKTTLVKQVYNDSSVKENIDHHAWITISNTYNVKNLLLDVIKQLLKEVKQEPPLGLETLNVDEVREYINNFLQYKKYLIVLDDVWSTNVWEALRYAFPSSNTQHSRGCIIITSRKENIGHEACCDKHGGGGHVYELKPLPSQIAEELFYKYTFYGGSCPDHLKEMSNYILRRCEGLPLAIVVIGRSLAAKKNKIEEWTRFRLNFESEVEDDHLKRIWNLLSLSYRDLPYYLKACLLYLSIFPEDVLLKKSRVIRLWTAEGLVDAKQGKTMEEIGEEYLIELSNRSLIQVVATSDNGRPKQFCIHDLVREYIISKAKEQNIVTIRCSSEIRLEDRIRRLALDDSSISSYGEKVCNLKYLRSLLFFGSVDLHWGQILRTKLRGNCRMLKILDLRGAPLNIIPNEVFKLYHLKYLSLRNTNVSLIPKSIGDLMKLEVLDLKKSRVVKLPVEILKLQRLQYLVVFSSLLHHGGDLQFGIQSFEAPYEIGRLLCLLTLIGIDASANIVKEIGKLVQLRNLGIAKLRKEHGKELCSSIAKLPYLRELGIVAIEKDELIDLQYSMPASSLRFLESLALIGRLEELPNWVPSLKALISLDLRWSRIRDEDLLKSLQQGLPNLQILEMYDAYDGEGLSFKSGGFQRLKKLSLDRMRGLRWVRVEEGSMPNLKELEIENCKGMMDLPQGIEHLTNLNEVDFTDMAWEFDLKVLGQRLSDQAEKVLQRKLHDDDLSYVWREYVEKQLQKRREPHMHHWKLAHVTKIFMGTWVDDKWHKIII